MSDEEQSFLEEEQIRNIKVVLIGDSGVGKTSVMVRYTNQKFSDEFQSTIGVDFMSKNVKLGKHNYMLQIWDTAVTYQSFYPFFKNIVKYQGQERYRTITSAYYRDTHGIMIIYDITQNKSFENVPYWVDSVREYAPKEAVILLVGNKSDLEGSRSVETKRAKQLEKELNVKFIEASAKTDTGITEAFDELLNGVGKKLGLFDNKKPGLGKNGNKGKDKKCFCC